MCPDFPVNYYCYQRMYLLKIIHQQGLLKHQLDIVYSVVIVVNRLTYALPAVAGFVTAALINMLSLIHY